MRHLLCFYFLSFSSLCLSQQKIVDSLEQVISQYEKPDTTYINLRNEYISKKSFLTPTDSTWLDFSLKTLEVANTINYTKGRIMACERIGVVYQYLLSDHYKAIDYYLEGLKIIDGEKSLEKYGVRLLASIGTIYLEQQEFDKALTNFKKALDYFPNSISMLSNIGNVYGKKKQSDSAIYYYKRAIKEAEKTSNYLYLANTKSDLSFVLSEVGKIKEALVNIEESLALVNTHKLEFIRMAVYINA
ncbi:MAG: tetratricopeptide repeat protein, partial [Chlorobi bacterium]|nr:tetratricopeptide repeat protein [Chlorobiota bacterium]